MSISKKILNRINTAYTKVISTVVRKLYQRNNLVLLKRHPLKRAEGEDAYIQKWKPFGRKPHLAAYRLFSQYIGPVAEIVPEDISASIIQPLLNPVKYRPFYQDKNSFEKILPASYLPKAIFRMICGAYLTCDYKPIDKLSDDLIDELTKGTDNLFIKPSRDSSSGHGVLKFSRNKNGILWCASEYKPFSLEFLSEYGRANPNFIVQSALTQSNYISQFNPSSINTLRVTTYKSVVDNRAHVCSIILRIGKQGSSVDNAHAGGLFVGVGMDGTIGKYACDQYGNIYDSFNGIDFKKGNYQIPDFQKVIKFAENVGDSILHHRLVAQDICIQANGEPRLVEFNISAFSVWLFQFTSGSALGKYTDEIIEYCSAHKNEVKKVFVEAF